ncbi:MAG: ATP phosphoribosyltransferase regulatory subunit [Rhodospirillales bacterium]|nr:ATP phosphoribosyltransferase regulatory subunit [Rhodospirillales bacterium]
MSEQHPALLPVGLRDLLPPEAEAEAVVVARLMAVLASHGYERVKPPLIEYEETLLSGAGAAMAPETFRLMDPMSQRMIGVRADMTPQVARIAASRLKTAPRPLRLSYAGQVLRVRGGQLRPERQVGQVGAELIGSETVAADVEAVSVAAEALSEVGVPNLSVDLTMPTLVPAICRATGVAIEQVRDALDHKDAARVAALGGAAAAPLGALLAAAGPAKRTLATLAALELPPAAAAERQRLAEVVARLEKAAPGLRMTLDPVENRGFEYHTGLTFTFFTPGASGELGRGGRYVAGNGAPEPATGFTLYTDTILQAVPAPTRPRRLFLTPGTPPEEARRLRREGWVTIAALGRVDDAIAEARRLGCTHVFERGALKEV